MRACSFLLQGLPQDVAHGDLEFFKVNDAVAVSVGFHEKVLPQVLVHPGTSIAVEQIVKVVQRNVTVPVGVHDPECALEILLVLQHFPINASRHELLEVYDTIAVVVALVDDFVPVDVILILYFGVDHLFQLPFGESTIAILVYPDEFSLQRL